VGTEGTHKWDAISYMLDDRAAWVRCLLDRRRTSEHHIFGPEMTTDPGPLGVVAFRNGTRLTIDGWNDVMMPYTYIFFGTRGRIELREWALGSEVGHAIEYWARDENDSDPQFGRRPLPRREFPYADPTEVPVSPEVENHPEYATVRALAGVVHCLETGAQPPSTGEHGRHALEIIAALHLSAEADMRQIDLPLEGPVLERQVDVR
jgi:predicted dehydrogenase